MYLDHTSDEVKKWSEYVKESMSNHTICLNLCVFLEKVDPKCTSLLNLAYHYNEVKSKAVLNQDSKIRGSLENNFFNINNKNTSTTKTKSKDVPPIVTNQVGASPQQGTPSKKQEQSTNGNKNENLTRLPTKIATLNVEQENEKPNQPAVQSVSEKLHEHSASIENANKIHTVSSTTNSLLPQQDVEKESVIQNIPTEFEKPGLDGLDDFGDDNNPPSSEKETQGSFTIQL
uniref:Uncharacterized protein n=1 Tax=Rhodnius prolixus TaxID=13249 RepID=T1IBL5_RHOPR